MYAKIHTCFFWLIGSDSKVLCPTNNGTEKHKASEAVSTTVPDTSHLRASASHNSSYTFFFLYRNNTIMLQHIGNTLKDIMLHYNVMWLDCVKQSNCWYICYPTHFATESAHKSRECDRVKDLWSSFSRQPTFFFSVFTAAPHLRY